MSMEMRMKARGNLAKAIVDAFPDTMVDPFARIALAAAIEDLIDAKIEDARPSVGGNYALTTT